MRNNFLAFVKECKAQAGFTMIELLVVISVIGILAVAVLSSINPIEQINKGRDTRLRSDAGQMLGAVERYFSIHEVYPWNETTASFPAPPSALYSAAFSFDGQAGASTPSVNGSTDWDWVDQLSSTQEVKPAFTVRLKNDQKLVVLRAAGTNASTYVCFQPSSYAFKLEAAKNCANGATQQSINSFTLCTTAASATVPSAPPVNGVDYICLP